MLLAVVQQRNSGLPSGKITLPRRSSTVHAKRCLAYFPHDGLKDKAVNMTVYLLPHDHKRLKQLAVEHDTTIQALVMDGLDVILKDNGQEPLTRWKTRRKPRG
ncbi:ribbon-helix-helix domain-containing protein [Acetobacter ascendens]|uniref:ribbon-helix-helix domain-containing protein n=1 Tax=Acetobacter ascendens TaxID=481146 RepID=UPI00138F9E61|nr:ribbon-helix-helix domain-containing protein [Acetobacter ascendens]